LVTLVGWLSAATAEWAAGDEYQGLDAATGVVHNGQWQNGVPLGAMGCGKFDVLPSGWFSRFSINHNWDEPTSHQPWQPSRATFFAVRAGTTTRWLRFGFREHELPGVTQVEHVAYHGQFPFVDATFHDPALPLGVAMHAWSALVPHNTKDSSLPVTFFEVTLTNTNAAPIEASLLFSLEHFIGCGGYQVHGQHLAWREQDGNQVEPAAVKDTPLTGLRFFSTKKFEGMKVNSSGEYWLLSDGPTITTGWNAVGDGKELSDVLSANPGSKIPNPKSPATAGAVCRKVIVPARGTQKLLFVFLWWMPHHVTMDGTDQGHYYQREFKDPAALAAYVFRERQRLRDATAEWGKLVTDSNLPEWLKRFILNATHPVFVNTLLTRDGKFSVHEDPSWMEGALGTLDQRTVAHVFIGTFFPELAKKELEIFGQCQLPSGEITHFLGNIYQVIGNPNVWYGVTQWPDLAAVYAWQVLKHYRWTGDRAFLDEAWPRVKRAMEWLVTVDRDGDGVPEGGTTYDAGIQYAGCFVFTASVYGAALRCAIEMAAVQKDAAARTIYEQRFDRVLATMRQRLWTGRYFAKCFLPDRNLLVPTLFDAQLAGDWLTRMVGLPRVVSAAEAQASLESLLLVNGRRSPWVVANEFMPDGSAHNDRDWFTYQFTYFAGQAMAEGWNDDALEIGWRAYDYAYHLDKTPWGLYLNMMPTLSGHAQKGGSYMSAMAGWWWLYQLAGASIDAVEGRLWVSPRLTTGQKELHMPLFFPRAWLWLDYAPGKGQFRLKVLRTWGEPVAVKQVCGDRAGDVAEMPSPWIMKPGAQLDLQPWHSRLITVANRPPVLEHRALPFRREGLATLSWTATTSDTNSNLNMTDAYDGYPHSRWQSSGPATKELSWTLDLGRSCRWGAIAALTTPVGFEVDVSEDQKSWQPVAPAEGNHRGRYVRLRPKLDRPAAEPWQIFEVNIAPAQTP